MLKKDGNGDIPVEKLSTLSFSRDGKGCLEYADNKYEFRFETFKPFQYKWEDSPNGFQIIIDDENYILFSTTSDLAFINMPSISRYMNLGKCENKEILDQVLKLCNKQHNS